MANYCYANDIFIINRALRLSNNSFLYRYRVFRKAQNQKPTVIFLPGGPGQTSIDANSTLLKNIPEEFGLILTDPRGVGCNINSELAIDDFQTQLLAQDVLSLIKDQKLSSNNVILYGVSYGTVLSTIVANENKQLNNDPFRLLVLEGTLGKAFNGHEYLDQFRQEWENYINSHDGETFRTKIELSVANHNLNRKLFADFIMENLIFGTMPYAGHILDDPLNLLINNFTDFIANYFTPTSTENSNAPAQESFSKLWSGIWCRELNESVDHENLYFENGYLRIHEDLDNCTHQISHNFYDAEKYQLREKIIYLQGSNDPATSLLQAQYHFNHQKNNPNKTFILFDGLAHSPSLIVQQLDSTLMPPIWRSDFNLEIISKQFRNVSIKLKVKSAN